MITMYRLRRGQIFDFEALRSGSLKRKETLHLLTNFYKVYFDTAYYLCCCPFRITSYINENGSMQFVIKSWWPHKVICGILMFSSLYWIVREFLDNVPSKDSKDPTSYFEFISWGVNLLWVIATLKQFWFNQQNIVRIFNYIVDDRNSIPVPDQAGWFMRKKFSIFICLVCITFCVAMGIGESDELMQMLAGQYEKDFELSNWNIFLAWLNALGVLQRFAFYESMWHSPFTFK